MIEETRWFEKFAAMIQKLNDGLPGANYSKPQMDLIEKHIRDLKYSDLAKIADHFLGKNRTKPTPNDFRQIAGAFRSRTNIKNIQGKDLDWFPNCRKCGDSGLLLIEDRQTAYQFEVRCECHRGTLADPNRNLPRWSDEMNSRFEIHWHSPYSREYVTQLARVVRVPGAVDTLMKRIRNGESLSGLQSDFDFITNQEWQNSKEISPKEIMRILGGA